MMLEETQRVIAMLVAEDEQQSVLTATENGYGKRTTYTEDRRQQRGGLGLMDIKTTQRKGKVVGLLTVRDDDEVMFITDQGKVVRNAVAQARPIGRNTQGVTLSIIISCLTRLLSNCYIDNP